MEQGAFFENKTVMYFIPHEDDEINMGGGMIHWLCSSAKAVHIVYATNGDYRVPAQIRMTEAYRSLQILGVKRENIHFLGYSDQATSGNRHLYQCDDWTSRNGRTETYIPEEITQRFGAESLAGHIFTKENLIADIAAAIESVYPDVLFAVDLDSHADHRALSLCFEAAIGRLFRQDHMYRPVVYKSFAYPTAYNGRKNLYADVLPDTTFCTEKHSCCALQNPYYRWEERIKFALPADVRTRILSKNVKYQALKQHRSQSIRSRADRILAGDEVAWQRGTDSVLYGAHLDATSGDPTVLNDFMLLDTSDIMNGNKCPLSFDRGVWIPASEDQEQVISIRLDEPVQIDRIRLYQGANSPEMIRKLRIALDDGQEQIFSYDIQDLKWDIPVMSHGPVSQIRITVLEKDGPEAGFSEIEAFSEKESSAAWMHVLYRGNILYPNTVLPKAEPSELSVWVYDGSRGFFSTDESCCFPVDDQKIHDMIQHAANQIKIQGKMDRLGCRYIMSYHKLLFKGLRGYYVIRRFIKKRIFRSY